MSCNFGQTKVGTSLKRMTGSDSGYFNALQSLVTNVVKDSNGTEHLQFTDGFVKYYQNLYNTDKVPVVENSERDKIAHAITDYYLSKHFDVEAQSENSYFKDAVQKYGYRSTADKLFIIKNFGTRMLQFNVNDINKGVKVNKETLLNDLADRMIVWTGRQVMNKYMEFINKQLSSKEVNSILNSIFHNSESKEQYMLDFEKAFKNADYQTNNMFAAFKEMIADRQGFFTTIQLSNPYISQLAYKDETADVIDEEMKSDMDMTEDPANPNKNDENGLSRDDYEQNHWEDSTGLASNFMKGFSDNIRNYLTLVPKMTSTNFTKVTENGKIKYKYQYDKSNPLNVVDFMDIKIIIGAITTHANRESIEDFLESIKDAAEIHGLEGLIKVYNDLKDNPDLAQRFRREFKNVINKYETQIVDDYAQAVKANKNNNAEQVLLLNLLNDVKYTPISVYSGDTLALVNSLNDKLKKYKEYRDKGNTLKTAEIYNEICSKLADEFSKYYPSMDKTCIETYVRLGNKEFNDPKEIGIEFSISNLKHLAEDSAKCREEYERKRDLIREVKDNKTELEEKRKLYEQDPYAPGASKAINKLNNEIDELDKQIQRLKDMDIRTQNMIKHTAQFANRMSNYSIIKIDLNSRNAAGNLQSDLINSSMITYLLNILNGKKRTEVYDDYLGRKVNVKDSLLNFGQFRFKGNQYKLSNILVESDNNYGMFRKQENGSYIPTEYAENLLTIGLFNGVSNPNTSENVLYTGMSFEDYVYTAFTNFFVSDTNIDKDREYVNGKTTINIPLTNYFMRTPSDAPKTFIVRSARYEGTPFIISNKKEIEDEINAETNRQLKTIDIDKLKEDKRFAKPSWISLDDNDRSWKQIINDFTSDKPINRNIWNNQTIILDKDKKVVVYGYELIDEFGYPTHYLVKAEIADIQGNKIKTVNGQATLIKEPNEPGHVKANVERSIRKKAYRDGYINDVKVNRQVDTQSGSWHARFRRVFEQELLNMATFIDKYYKTSSEVIADPNNPSSTKINTSKKVHIERDNTEGENKGKPLLKDDYTEDELNKELYKLYHIGNGHKSVVEKVDGKWRFTGNMFTSDKFTIVKKDGTIKNYGQEILNEVFNGLYGESINDIMYRTDNNEITLDFTDEQNKKIDEKIAEFIEDYVDDNVRKFDQFKDLDISNRINDDNVAEFVLNYRLAYINFDDLFEGDTKFYKSSQDFLKRAKEAQAGGVSYSTFNLYQDLTATPTIMSEDFSRLNSKAIQDKLKSLNLDVQQRTGFNGVTVKNTVKTTEEVAENGPIAKHLRDIYIQNGMNPDEAMRKANEHMAGFKNTTVNDAQSYITFEEWIRRVAARGQLDEYMPLIEAIQTDKPIPTNLINKFVQVQKDFYYDIHFDDNTQTYAPRQIKNAEFVLVPRFIKGTQLEDVYNAMKANGIDQLNTVETSKAGKARILEIFDEKTGEVTKDHLDNFNLYAKKFTETYYYEFLYTQQETPQHMNAKNKAGIQIMKKILDNISDEKTKNLFMDLYAKNIEQAFRGVAEELNIPLDEDGAIKVDGDGNIQGIHMPYFMNRLRRECMRQGFDSNMLEYFTLNKEVPLKLDGRPNTVADSYMSNVIQKAQSVVQSLFNSAITRQTLPGFHAAQITNVGFSASDNHVVYKLTEAGKGKNLKDNLTKEEYEKLAKKNQMFYQAIKGEVGISKQLKYHPVVDGKVQPYVEVMLPKSNFGFYRKEDGTYKHTDEELLKQLQNAKLDQFIGYRIPTEGKQSICLMKVVGFTDDALGSTIVVPDNWVSQTGSDFDIDSVYGIQHSSYLDGHGVIHKIEYKNEGELNIYDYANYINRHLEKSDKLRHLQVGKKFDALKIELDKHFNKLRADLSQEESEAYETLSDETKELVKEAHEKFTTKKINKKTGKLSKDGYLDQLKFVTDYIEENKKELDDADKDFIEVHADMIDAISNEYKDKANYKSDKVNKILQERLDIVESKAKDLGLMSYDEFVKSNPLDINSTKARSNKIVDIMKDILSSDEAFEENTSQSQFADIIDARDEIIDKEIKNARKNRSCYDFLNQAAYQEDVMSGAKLKGFSVSRDTFCSICNVARPKINADNGIYIRYNNYNNSDLRKRFDIDGISCVSEDNVVKHTTIGWTNDNRQVDGHFLTTYSSETTAHILDAVKEGAIPGVTDYTFSVYKTLVDIGSNYKTAVSFIMHPAVKRIVDAYNEGKSIYTQENVKPITEALRVLAEDAGINTDDIYGNKTLINALNAKFDRKYDLYKNNSIILDADELSSEVKLGNKTPLDRQYDIIMAYNDINRITQGIQSMVFVCNPDKFGAKQTIFATDNVFRKIAQLHGTKKASMLTINDKPFLEAIYPGLIDENGYIDKIGYLKNKERGAYGSLNAFMKYASTTSTFVNSMLFETQRKEFVNQVLGLQRAFGVPRSMTEDEYKDFERYIISDASVDTVAIKSATTIDSSTGRIVFRKTKDADGNIKDISESQERIRIYGYNRPQSISFNVKDIVHPTQEEIDKWAYLSPAQKVGYLQAHSDKRGIFDFIQVDMYDNYKLGTREYPAQSIRFKEDSIDPETAYTLFENAATSSNPLIKLAAIDLIKYAFVVEEYKMRKGGINKMIRNRVLRDDSMFIDETGKPCSIMSQIRTNMTNIGYRDCVEDYVRSHSDARFIPHKDMKKERKGRIWLDQIRMDATHGYLIELNIPLSVNDEQAMKRYVESLKDDTSTNEGFEVDEESDETSNDETNEPKEEKNNLAEDQERDIKLATKFGFFDANTERDTPYIVINHKIGKRKFSTLFKTERQGDKLFAYPLNKLDSNEHSLFSINPTNNELRFPSPLYYKLIIEDRLKETSDISSEQNDELKRKYRSDINIAKTKWNRNVNIQEDARRDIGGAKDVIKKLTDAIISGNNQNIIFNNLYLADRIGYKFGNIQTITAIVNTKDINGNDVQQEVSQRFAFRKVATEVNGIPTGYTSAAVEATPIKESSNDKESSTIEFEFDTYKDISRRSKEGDILAYNEINHLKDLGFTELKADFETYQSSAYDSISRYTKAKINKLVNDSKQFYKDDNGHWLSMFDSKIIDIIRNKPAIQRNFLKILLDAKAINEKYSTIYDVIEDKNTPDDIKEYIKTIKESIKYLNDNINLSELNARFAREIVAKWSDDPKVQNNIIDVFNGFHTTSWADAWIGDLQDSGNTLVQIVTKHIMADIRGKEMAAQKEADDFLKHIKELSKLGNVDWNKLINEHGVRIRNYNAEFEAELTRLNNNVNNAKLNIDENPEEYIKAKHEYDIFKLKYINRPVVDNYYKELLDNEELIMSTKVGTIMLAEYTRLREKVAAINKRRDNGRLTPELEREYKQVRTAINRLNSEYDSDLQAPKQVYSELQPMPGVEYLPDGTERIVDEEKFKKAALNSLGGARTLQSYLDKLREIKAKYLDTKAKDTFEETLDKMLDIVNDAERRDAYGYKQVSDEMLNNNSEYQRAKAWLDTNAIWRVDKAVIQTIANAFSILKDNKLATKNKRTFTKKQALIQEKLAKGIEVYDNQGRIKGDIFTEEEQQAIQIDEQNRYTNTLYAAGNEKYLISNAPETTKVYPRIVYNMLTNNNSMPNQDYLKLVNEINAIIRPYYDTERQEINFITDTNKISKDDLKRLAKLYAVLRETKKSIVPDGLPDRGKSVAKFIRDFFKTGDETYNMIKFREEEAKAKNIGGEYFELWKEVNMEYEPMLDDKGFVMKDSEGKIIYNKSERHPNRFLYGNLILDEDKFFNLIKDKRKRKELIEEMENKTAALGIIQNYLEQTVTPYYSKARKEAAAKGEKEFTEWYERNHVYNPYKHKYEPIGIWQKTNVVPSYANGKWKPAFPQQITTPRKGFENSEYNGVGSSNKSNFKTNPEDNKYTNKVELNEAEQKTLEYLEKKLYELVHDPKNKRYIDDGYMPNVQALAKQDIKWFIKQVGEFFGWSDYGNKIGNKDLLDNMNYSTDFTPTMPMFMKQIKTKASKNVEELKRNPPRREECASDEEYTTRLEEHKKRIEEAEKINEQIHIENLDRNFAENMATFIKLAGHFNAVQDNKYLFYYLQNTIKTQEVLESNLGYRGLRRDPSKSTKDTIAYHKEVDERLYKQLSTWGSRLIFDSYKMPNATVTKAMNITQSLTSAKFMMLNIIGGIENVTVGRSAMFGEHIAKQFVTTKNWEKGKSMWYTNSLSFIRGLYSDNSTSLADAIVKLMNVVDFDEVTGRAKGSFDGHNAIERLRDFMYSPNAMGEHMMQNGMMFAMMYENKLVPVENYKSKGRLPYQAMSFSQYKNKVHEQALREIVAGTEFAAQYEKFIADIKDDENKLKDYARNRKDVATEFSNIYLNNAKKKEFEKRKKELEIDAKKKFDAMPSLMEQLDLVDGKLGFKEGSLMEQLSNQSTNSEINKAKKKEFEINVAYAILGEFKGKVIAVNKEIHGVYDRLGAAQLEKYWFGSLLMQYHKHIYPGMLKHWRKKGYFNEELGADLVGCGPALYDFITMPIRQYNERKKRLTEEQLNALEGTQSLFKAYINFAENLRLNWNILPDYQKSAILRATGDVLGALSAICIAIGTRVLWDDDELKENIFANLMLREADGLATQSMMYNPVFLPSQAKTLWSSPIAGLNGPKDIYDALNVISQSMFDDDFDWNYTTGRYKGENKFAVRIKRQIPIYRQWSNFEGLSQSNSYYNMGEHILSVIPVKSIAEDIKGK